MACQQKIKGFSLIELIIAMAAATILVLVGGVLLLGSNKAYSQVYDSIHDPIAQDSRVLTVTFGAMGRQSNRNDYTIYKVRSGNFIEAVPDRGESVAAGQAVEFHYWEQSFDELFSGEEGMDVTDVGTHYALFYLDGDKLYADYGRIINDLGAVQNGSRSERGLIRKVLLAQDVDVSKTPELFSHEMQGGTGSGCVNMNVTLTNDEGKTVDIKTATLLRITWPN